MQVRFDWWGIDRRRDNWREVSGDVVAADGSERMTFNPLQFFHKAGMAHENMLSYIGWEKK